MKITKHEYHEKKSRKGCLLSIDSEEISKKSFLMKIVLEKTWSLLSRKSLSVLRIHR